MYLLPLCGGDAGRLYNTSNAVSAHHAQFHPTNHFVDNCLGIFPTAFLYLVYMLVLFRCIS